MINVQSKSIEGYEDYLIYEDGRVFSIKRNKFLKPQLRHKGYLQVNLCKNNKSSSKKIHRLVGQAFIFNPENKKEINHLDNNPKNNDVSNLEWVTHQENVEYSNNQNRQTKGSNVGTSKLTEPMILIIRKLLAEGELTQTQIGSIFNVGQNCISKIKLTKRWRHIHNVNSV